MPARLGAAYALLLRLGRFLETDIRVQHDELASDDPLDAEIHGPLTDLVRTAAPWLRGFPTVATWDDEAGKALLRADLFQPAREFARIAREKRAIPEADAAQLEALAEAAETDDFQGRKAGNRLVGDTTNLLLAGSGAVAEYHSNAVTADPADRPERVQRWDATLAAAEAPIGSIATALDAELREAVVTTVERSKQAVQPVAELDFPLSDAAASSVLPEASAPRSASAEAWADETGTDKYGRWASFSVAAADGSRVSQRLRWCPPGWFMMGSPEEEGGHRDAEGPVHRVDFARGFWMFETACRQELWQAVMGEQSEQREGGFPAGHECVLGRCAPVHRAVERGETRSWRWICRRKRSGNMRAGPARRRRTASVRRSAGSRSIFCSGGTVPVGSLPANEWGLYEMHGNVWEWCLDTWHGSYEGAPSDGSARVEAAAANRVIRGGSWNDDARYVRAAYRNGCEPAYRDDHLGFRCARVQSDSEAKGGEEPGAGSGATKRRRTSP